MRFIYYISLLTILIISSANSKNINIQDINFDVPQRLEQLNSLYKSGVLTKEEFEKAKKKILN